MDVLVERRRDPAAPGRIALSVTAAEEYRTTAMELAIRAPAGARSGTAPATITAEAPGGAFPSLTVDRDDEYAVVAAEELAEVGESTLSLGVRVHPESPVEAVDLRVGSRVRGGGRAYATELRSRRSMLAE